MRQTDGGLPFMKRCIITVFIITFALSCITRQRVPIESLLGERFQCPGDNLTRLWAVQDRLTWVNTVPVPVPVAVPVDAPIKLCRPCFNTTPSSQQILPSMIIWKFGMSLSTLSPYLNPTGALLRAVLFLSRYAVK
jgi:hypothetical protein